MTRALVLALICCFLTTTVLAAPFLSGLFNDGSFDAPFTGELEIDGWYLQGPVCDGSESPAVLSGCATKRADETEVRHQASHTLGGVTRAGVIRMAELGGNGKVQLELVGDRCTFMPLGNLNEFLSWNYEWGKEPGSGGFVSAKLRINNPAFSFVVTFVSLSPNIADDMWITENIDFNTGQVWVIANMLWFGALDDDTSGAIQFVNSPASAISLFQPAFNALNAIDPSFPIITVAGFPDVGGVRRSLAEWLNPATDLTAAGELLDGTGLANVNPIGMLLGAPLVVSAQLGVGTITAPFDCYLASSQLSFGSGNVYNTGFDAPNMLDMSEFFTCPGPPAPPACVCDLCDFNALTCFRPPFGGNWAFTGNCVIVPSGITINNFYGGIDQMCIMVEAGGAITGITETRRFDDCLLADMSNGFATMITGDGNDCVVLNGVTTAVTSLDMGDGDDVAFITGTAFTSTIEGGDGNDYFEFRNAQTADVEGGDGDDIIYIDMGSYANIVGGADNDICTVLGSPTITSIDCDTQLP